jgi:hypothetical protein
VHLKGSKCFSEEWSGSEYNLILTDIEPMDPQVSAQRYLRPNCKTNEETRCCRASSTFVNSPPSIDVAYSFRPVSHQTYFRKLRPGDTFDHSQKVDRSESIGSHRNVSMNGIGTSDVATKTSSEET